MGYTAEQNEDGTWRILDVPFFSVTSMTTSEGDDFEFDEEWLKDAVEWHEWKHRIDDGYMEPLNVHHTSDPRGKYHAGRFLPNRVGKFKFDGESQATAFCDLRQIPGHTYARIKSGELTYLSAESNNVRNRRFSALALMPDTSPHHKYPPIRIDEERPYEPEVRQTNVALAPVELADAGALPLRLVASSENPLRRQAMPTLVAKRQDRRTGQTVFEFSDGRELRHGDADRWALGAQFDDDSDDDKDKPPVEAKDDDGDDDKPDVEAKDDSDDAPDIGGSDDDDDDDDEGGGLSVDQIATMLKGAKFSLDDLGALRALVEEMTAALAGQQAPVAEQNTVQTVEPGAQMNEHKRKAIEAKAENDALRQRVDAIEAKDTKREAIADAGAKLRDAGHVFQDGELDAMFDENGAEGLKVYTDTRCKFEPAPVTPMNADAGLSSTEMAGLPGDFEFSENPETAAKQLAAHESYGKSAYAKRNHTVGDWINLQTLSVDEYNRLPQAAN